MNYYRKFVLTQQFNLQMRLVGTELLSMWQLTQRTNVQGYQDLLVEYSCPLQSEAR